MFKIYDGRDNFYQWDLDRKLIVADAAIDEVHFCNRTDDCSLVCKTYTEGNLQLVNVPNILLQNNFRINVYAYDKNYTKHAEVFNVVARTKPDDYVYTEDEIKSWEALEERVNQIEEEGISDEAIDKAITKYLDENSIETGATAEEAAQIAANTAAIEELQKIEIPVVPTEISAFENDANYVTKGYVTSNYYTESEIDKKVEKINEDIAACEEAADKAVRNLRSSLESNYATKTYVDNAVKDVKVDTTGLATEQYVDDAIAAIEVGGEEIKEVYVGTTEPTDTNALIWINPEGEASENVATTDYVDAAIKSALEEVENGTY